MNVCFVEVIVFSLFYLFHDEYFKSFKNDLEINVKINLNVVLVLLITE